ncbi:hypothetical protein C4K26_5318 [Pseudomonas chlororaphis]|nr:hypothetical protein C4K26_5318 [Pseudomonas chlororaphis]
MSGFIGSGTVRLSNSYFGAESRLIDQINQLVQFSLSRWPLKPRPQ